MSENQVIPEAAVEAAAEIVAYRLSQIHPHERNPQHEARVLTRIILEAALPHMRRIVTTVADLDALPAGSVVMGFDVDGDQLVSRKSTSGGLWEQAGTDDGWQAAGIIEWHGSVTVLYEP